MRLIAIAPIAFSSGEADTRMYIARRGPGDRPEFKIGADIARAMGPRYFWLLAIARLSCIPFSLLGALICLRWASELFGFPAGFVALVLWVFSPSVLAYGHLITSDMGATGVGLWALFEFRRWLFEPRVLRAVLAGSIVGLAALTKTTWIMLIPLLLIEWAAVRALEPLRRSRGWITGESLQLGACILVAMVVLNIGYGVQGTFKRLGTYDFVSRALSGRATLEPELRPVPGNRFAESPLRMLRVPLPESYLLGIDQQKLDFERGLWSYLRGEWRHGGWWYYYLYAMFVKGPLGTWALLGLCAFTAFFRKGYLASHAEEFLLLAPPCAILALNGRARVRALS